MFNHVIAILLFLLLANITSVYAKVRGESKIDSLPSKILAEQRELLIHLPNNYQLNTELDYPVLYLLDGQRNFNHVIGSLDLHNQDNNAQEMIIVAIKNTHRTRDFTPTYDESYNEWGISGGADNFLDFLEQELIPYINKNYRTNKFKVLSGHSLSGLFAVYAMQTRPELFQAHFAFSPSLWWHNKVIFQEAEHFFANTSKLNSYLYINMGNEGGMMLSAYQQYLQLLKKHTPEGFRYHESLVEQEGHNTTALAGHPKAFHSLQQSLQCPKEIIEQGLVAIEQFYQQQSELYGYQITPSYRAINHAGYLALEKKDIKKAIEIFTYNVKNYPYKADSYDSLADGLAADGQLNKALNMMNTAIKKSVIENVENNSFKHHRDNLLNRIKER
ncbi:alpha/beta hydrolase [Thalassotalea sp. PP2-459]|uniref:alpha/beta hydrolase n=1 Tax=Thalassotalea sp. PP2-459 TaxID=1742724 RepID=UPI0009438A9E|nr:alpha/beta hydrolase-fold protein [Thalassotalea sp. PP2-459]OKY27254.1 esterase [Thalassotalea sp. PP2-459]